MITELICALEVPLAAIPVAQRYGQAELRHPQGGVKAPWVLTPTGYKSVEFDTMGSWSYWRIAGDTTYSFVDIFSCSRGVRATTKLRFVACVERTEDVDAVVRTAVQRLMLSRKAIATALSALNASVDGASHSTDQERIYLAEFSGPVRLPVGRVLIAIDTSVSITAEEGCLPLCEARLVE
jgi:hypothetical protein